MKSFEEIIEETTDAKEVLEALVILSRNWTMPTKSIFLNELHKKWNGEPLN